MKVLTLALDKNELDFKSPVGQRNLDYAGLAESLEIIVLGAGGESKQSGNLKVYSTADNKIASLFRAYKIGKKILDSSRAGEFLILTQDPFFTGIIGYLLKRKFNVPLQIQVHTSFFSPYFKRESLKNRIQVILANFLLPKADGIRVVSKKIQEYLVNDLGIKEDRITVLPIYTDVQKIIDAKPNTDLHKKYPQFDFIILIASRLVKSKNISSAISAMSEIIAKYPNLGMIIVGSGPEENRLKAESEKMNSNIVFEPWSGDIISYYKTADLFLLPSYYEGFVRTPIEAMAAECPVLMSDTSLPGDVFSPGYNCSVFSINDKHELVNKILFLIENADMREELKIHALETIKTLPTKAEYLSDYFKSWQNCFS